jgi:hypothetical protein
MLLFASFSAEPATAFRSRKLAAVSVECPSPSYSQQRAKASGRGDDIASLVSVPRGGAAGTTEGSTETTTTEGGVEGEAAAEDEIEDAEEEEEEEVDVFPTDQIPSDDVRFFHTTDGEEADDEGMYTDGQNENPIADNEAAAAATEEEGVAGLQNDVEAAGDQDDSSLREVDIEGATAIRTAASVAIIDDDLKKVLVTDLRYTNDDVSKMRPEIARDVVHNKLARPTEGMPKNWYSDPETAPSSTKASSLLSHLAKKKGLVVSVAFVGTGAAALVLKNSDNVGETLEDFAGALKSLVGMVVAAKKSVQDRISAVTKSSKETPAPAPVAATESAAEEEESPEGEDAESKDTSIHSIKPGTTPNEVPDPDVDHSWLDKGITQIGNLFKSFFNIKI